MYLINFWTHMFDFKGRIGIFEFWIPVIFYHFAFYAICLMPEGVFEPLMYIYMFGYLPACISSGVRRLHDINFSGFWIILFIVPVLNIALTIMWFLPSEMADAIVKAGSTKPQENNG